MAMVPSYNRSRNKGTNVKKLSIVTICLQPPNLCIRLFTTFLLVNPSPFRARWCCPGRSYSVALSALDVLLPSLWGFPVFPQYTSKSHKYFDNASAAAHILIPNRIGFLIMYCLIGQYLPLYMSMASSTVICWLGVHMVRKQWQTSSIIYMSLCNLSYVGLSLSYTSTSTFATCKHLVINWNRSWVIHWDISGHQNSGSICDQYNIHDGNFFNPISKKMPMYARNSSTQNEIHSLPLLVVPFFSSITLEAYRLLFLIMRCCSFNDQNFWKSPASDGRRPYECVHPGSGPVNSRGALL